MTILTMDDPVLYGTCRQPFFPSSWLWFIMVQAQNPRRARDPGTQGPTGPGPFQRSAWWESSSEGLTWAFAGLRIHLRCQISVRWVGGSSSLICWSRHPTRHPLPAIAGALAVASQVSNGGDGSWIRGDPTVGGPKPLVVIKNDQSCVNEFGLPTLQKNIQVDTPTAVWSSFCLFFLP